MHFITPEWLYALGIIPILIVTAILTRRSRSKAWKSLVAERLRKKLVHQTASTRHWLSFTLLLLSLFCVIVALARPYHGETTTNEKVQSRNILFAIDTSKSMLCRDVSTDRLTAAKSLALQMLDRFPADRIGVLIFAGSSNVIAPLTVDHLAVHDTIAQVDTSSIPTGGSNLADAIDLAIETLNNTGKRANALVIFSDGEEHDSGIDKVIESAKKSGIQIITIGIGTTSGGIIPSQQETDGKHRNPAGKVVHTKLHQNILRKLALETNGAYTSIDNSPESVISNALKKMETFEQDGRQQVVPHERYYWFLIPSVVFALAASLIKARWSNKKPLSLQTAIAITILSIASHDKLHAEQSWLESAKNKLFIQPAAEKQAIIALKNKDYKATIKSAKIALKGTSGDPKANLSAILAEAQYRSGHFDAALSSYSDVLLSSSKKQQAQARYNMGNAIFQKQWNDLAIPKDSTLKETLTKKLQSGDIKTDDIKQYIKSFSAAISQYQQASEISSIQQTTKNTAATNAILKELNDLLKQSQQQDQKKEDQKKKDDDKKKDGDKAKDGEKDKGKDGDKKEDSGKGGEKKEDKGKNGEKKEDGDKGKDGDKTKDGDEGKDGEPSDDNAKDGSQGEGGDQGKPISAGNQKPEHGYSIKEQKDARKLLQSNADLQQRPNPRKTWRSKNPEIDW